MIHIDFDFDAFWDGLDKREPSAVHLDTIMPFGKYAGKPVEKIPADYRRWMLDNFDWRGRYPLQRAIAESLGIKSV